VYRFYFYDPGNCFDNIINGNEKGTDCGGACVRICAADVVMPKIVWAESFEIVGGQYNAVAYIENSNQIAATPELQYTFELLSGTEVVATRKGTTVLPPNSVYPVFEGRIMTEGKEVTETRLTLEAPTLWLPASIGREQFESSNVNLSGADARPRLDAVIKNTALTPAEKIEIVATLFNDAGTPITASQTFVDHLEPRSTKDVVFTWPNSIAKTVRSCIIPTDVAVTIDLSGSMNNDGGDPPQPVTDALAAAKVFVSELKTNDQATIVTFATDALVAAPLNKNHMDTATLVGNLTIDPKSETGYTNTSAALRTAARELASERHNGDARRVVVLLTDGLPTATDRTADPVVEARTVAKEVIDAGAELYVIGLGKNVDLPFITSLAVDKEHAFYAPTTADLGAIYKSITSSLCESGTSKIEVIAKTPTNFAPLR
jgi:Mg-chelatase subunit ChlD